METRAVRGLGSKDSDPPPTVHVQRSGRWTETESTPRRRDEAGLSWQASHAAGSLFRRAERDDDEHGPTVSHKDTATPHRGIRIATAAGSKPTAGTAAWDDGMGIGMTSGGRAGLHRGDAVSVGPTPPSLPIFPQESPGAPSTPPFLCPSPCKACCFFYFYLFVVAAAYLVYVYVLIKVLLP